MNRKNFIHDSLKLGLGCCAVALALRNDAAGADAPAEPPSPLQREKDFTDNWLTDLLAMINAELDEPTRVKLIEGCGRGCYRRHQFKQDIAAAAHGTVDGLVEAYHSICEAWREGDDLHLRYGETSAVCYCPVLRGRALPHGDLHCHCTKATHQAIVETALGRPVRMEIVETLRRGGRTCHFVAHVG